MSKIKNGGLDQHGKVKALTGSAVKGLKLWQARTITQATNLLQLLLSSIIIAAPLISWPHHTRTSSVHLRADRPGSFAFHHPQHQCLLQSITCHSNRCGRIACSWCLRVHFVQSSGAWSALNFLHRAAKLALQVLYMLRQIRPSVRPSVCPPHSGIVSKWVNAERCGLHVG